MPYFLSITAGGLFECLLAIILVTLATLNPRPGRILLVKARAAGRALAHNERRLVLTAALAPVILRLLLLTVDPPPAPIDMEEHNHILQAQTYALGRLANPTHPLGVLLQSFQTIAWPHSVSARPILPAIFLVPGTALGTPFAGNLLAVALASAALAWMLLGWLPKPWAAIGTLLAIASFCLFGSWVNSYWCPATPVLGGALLLGLVPRVEHQPRWSHGALVVPALLLLAFTRPYENAVFAALVFLWLAARFLRPARRPMLPAFLLRIGLPAATAGLAIILAQAGYDAATTGNPLLMPYQVWRASQEFVPTFLWQKLGSPPHFFNVSAARFAQWEASVVAPLRQPGPFAAALLLARHTLTLRDLLGPFLVLPLLCWSPRAAAGRGSRRWLIAAAAVATSVLLLIAWGWAGAAVKCLLLAALALRWRNAGERLPILLVLGAILATSLPAFYMSIYIAAFTAPLLLLAVQGLQHVARSSSPAARGLAGSLLLGAALLPAFETVARALGSPLSGPVMSRFDRTEPNPLAQASRMLAALPGRHAVFLRTKNNRPLDPVWLDPIWNAPNPDTQKTVWLRDLRPDWTAAAEAYYAGRQFWLMVLDDFGTYTLAPYPSAALPPPAPLASLPQPDKETALRLGAREPNN